MKIQNIYIHNKKTYKGFGHYIGRPSVFGNPYSHLKSSKAKFKVETVEEAVEKYKEWFEEQLLYNYHFKKEFDALVFEYKCGGELHLICWCDKICHGTVIAKKIIEVTNESA